MLLNQHVFVQFLKFLLLLNPRFIPLWSYRTFNDFIYLLICREVFMTSNVDYPKECFICWWKACVFCNGKMDCSEKSQSILQRSIVQLNSVVTLLIFDVWFIFTLKEVECRSMPALLNWSERVPLLYFAKAGCTVLWWDCFLITSICSCVDLLCLSLISKLEPSTVILLDVFSKSLCFSIYLGTP